MTVMGAKRALRTACRRITVQCNVRGRDVGSFVAEARRKVQQLIKSPSWPDGYTVSWGGQFEQQQRAMARLRVMIPVALLLIFILLYLNFRETRPVFLILSNRRS